MPEPQKTGILDALAFACEIAMVVLLVLAGHGFVPGWFGWLVGLVLAAMAVVIWAQWMAPSSDRRLPLPQRRAVQVVMFVTTGVYALAGGLGWWGPGFALFASAVFLLRREPA